MTEKLRKATFQYIEREVFDFPETLKEIKLIEYENLHSTSKNIDDPQAGRSSVMTITDETYQKATALEFHRQYQKMKTNTSAIKHVYDGLVEEKKELIRLYYWDRPGELTWNGIAKKLHIGRATALRWRKAFIYEIARKLGER